MTLNGWGGAERSGQEKLQGVLGEMLEAFHILA